MQHYTHWNQGNGFVPAPGEYVRVVGACHPRSYGRIVLVTSVGEDADGPWYASCYEERGEVLYSGGVLGAVEPVDMSYGPMNLNEQGVPVWR